MKSRVITKGEAIKLWNAMTGIKYDKANPRFAYAISRNKKKLLPLIKEIVKVEESLRVPEVEEFNKKVKELHKDFTTKGENGKAVFDKEGFEAKIKKMEEEYKDAFKKSDENAEKHAKYLKEEVNIEYFEMNMDYFPDTITVEQMDELINIIKE